MLSSPRPAKGRMPYAWMSQLSHRLRLQVHVFLDLRPDTNGDPVADGCIITSSDKAHTVTPARSNFVFDDVPFYTGARVICENVTDIPQSAFQTLDYRVRLSWKGLPYVASIPIQQVILLLCCWLWV